MVNIIIGKVTLHSNLIRAAFDAQYQMSAVSSYVQISGCDACLKFQDISGACVISLQAVAYGVSVIIGLC